MHLTASNHSHRTLDRVLRSHPSQRSSSRFTGKELSTRKTRAIPPRVSTPPLTVRSLNSQLAARIAVSNLHKNTIKSFSET
jgi:hypothetical protein